MTLLTTRSDRVEVEWKYILKLHPDESQRLKPSANAKPLPEHMKESDASLDITNRTDGVPDIGDPFHDPHSEQKWAEWHTAPEVTRRTAKVDLGKENQLWYYLGKPSTEARPQYTEDLAKPRNNPKSNFLETVKPPPPPVPAFIQRSYPASYPLKPAPIAVPPRTPMQQQYQASARPYQYKPKEPYVTAWKSPVYNPDTRKNPNSPVAHQPNVSYDHRPPSQGCAQKPYQGQQQQQYRAPPPTQQQYQYHPYVPPQAHSTANWKAQPASPGARANGTYPHTYTPQSTTLPPNPYASQPAAGSPPQLPPYPWSQGGAPNMRSSPYSTLGQAPSGRGSMSNPTGTPKPTKYADTPSSIVYAAKTPTEYLAYVMQFPYLKNAYLRRAKTYVSPYSPGGGFSESWQPKQHNSSTPTALALKPGAPSPVQPQFPGQAPQPNGPPSRPTAQFQSSDAFQRDMQRTSQPIDGAPKWEQMLKHLATSTGSSPAAAPAAVAGPLPTQPYYAPPPQSTGVPPVAPHDTQPPHTQAVPQPPPQRPIPSPISDDGKSGEVAPAVQNAPTLPPLQDAPTLQGASPAQAAPPVHGGETWRYT